MNGGIFIPPVATTAKGFVRMKQTTQTVDSTTTITGLTFEISYSIPNATSVAVLNGWASNTWWEVAVTPGQTSIVYSPTPEELSQIDTTKVFPNSYWDNFLLIVKSENYPYGEIGVSIGDLDPAGVEAEGNGSFGIIAGLIALLDDQLRKATREQFGTEIGFDNPYLKKEDYIGLPQLLPDADADGDGATNMCEYENYDKNYCRELVAKCVGNNVITKDGVDTGSNSTRKGSFEFRLWYDPEADEYYMEVKITPGVTLSKITQIGIFDGMNNQTPLIYDFPGPFTTSPYTHRITQEELMNMPEATTPHLIICTSNLPGITDRGEIGADLVQYCPQLFQQAKRLLLTKQEEPIRYVTAALDPSIRPQYCKVISGCQILLKNDRVNPPVPNISTGTVSVDVMQNLDQEGDYRYRITITHNVAGPISAGIYVGDIGENGDLLIDLGNPTSPIDYLFSQEDMQAVAGGIPLYVLIKSENYPDGELRAQLDCTASVRFVNGVYGSGPLDVCGNGMPGFVLVDYGTATNYFDEVGSAKYDIRLLPGTGSESTCENTPVLRTSYRIYGDSAITLVATGSAEYPTLFTLEDDNRPPAAGYANIRFVNAVKEGYNVDFYFVSWPPELSPLFSDVKPLRSTNYYSIIAPDTLSIDVKITGTEDVLASFTDYTFLPGGVYTILLLGPTPLKNGYELLILEDVPGQLPAEGEGVVEGAIEGVVEGEGTVEGTPEGVIEGEGVVEGAPEGVIEGEGTIEGAPEGVVEGEVIPPFHSADRNGNNVIELGELLRVIQFFNIGGYHCALPGEPSEDGYVPGYEGDKSCRAHATDYNPQNWRIELSELLRLIQFFNMQGYYVCPGQSEDNYCPGQPG